MAPGDITVGRRVAEVADVELPGDYCGPIVGYTGPEMESCFFILPNAGQPPNDGPGSGSLDHVNFPPHTYRECADGSLEIRASIGAMPRWHGYLDEGHRWREVA